MLQPISTFQSKVYPFPHEKKCCSSIVKLFVVKRKVSQWRQTFNTGKSEESR